MSNCCIEEFAYLTIEKPKEEGARIDIIKEALIHLNTSARTGNKA